MRLLKSTEQAVVPVDNPASPIVIIINDPAIAQQLISSTRNMPRYQQPQETYKDIPRKSRLQQLIRQEREFLQETTAEFVNAAKRFIGSFLSWIVWRMVVPMVLLSAVLMVFR